MKKKPSSFVTIIIAVLNDANTLSQCLKSIISQTHKKYKLIIIDGGSTDGTLSIIKKYENFVHYWQSEPDTGIYNAWNKALKYATGEWICFLGADDYFHDPDVLLSYQNYLSQANRNGIRIVYGRIARVRREDESFIEYWGKPWEKIRWQMPHGMPLGLPHTGMMQHASLFKDHGLFDESFKLAGDYEFLLRELKDKNKQAFFADELVTVVQRVGGTADANNLKFHQEVNIARRKNGLPRFSWLWWLVHLRALWRSKVNKQFAGV